MEGHMQQLQGTRASLSTPLAGATVFRPGGKLALSLLFVPLAGALAALGYFVLAGKAVPLWAPALVFAWLLLLPFIWLTMKAVRAGESGLAVGRPWQQWTEISWGAISRAEKHGWRLRVIARDGAHLSFIPGLLHGGEELRTLLLARVDPQSLDVALREEAASRALAAPDLPPDVALPSVLRVGPRGEWRAIAVLLALAALAGGTLAVLDLPLALGGPIAVAAGAGVVAAVAAFSWFSQRITVTETGISAMAFPSGRASGMRWADIVLIEYAPRQRRMRLRGKQQVIRLAGPGLMRPLDRAVFRAYLQRCCLSRGNVLVSRRFWIL